MESRNDLKLAWTQIKKIWKYNSELWENSKFGIYEKQRKQGNKDKGGKEEKRGKFGS